MNETVEKRKKKKHESLSRHFAIESRTQFNSNAHPNINPIYNPNP